MCVIFRVDPEALAADLAPETLKRFWNAVKDVGSDIANFFNEGVKTTGTAGD